MPVEETRIVTRSASARIIAAGIVIAFCYFASTVLVTLLVAVLMAYFLDPVVTRLEDALRLPRPLGSLLVVVVTLALLASLGWLLIERLDQFGNDWPKYRAPLRSATEMFPAASRTWKRTFPKLSRRSRLASRYLRSPIPTRCGPRSSVG